MKFGGGGGDPEGEINSNVHTLDLYYTEVNCLIDVRVSLEALDVSQPSQMVIVSAPHQTKDARFAPDTINSDTTTMKNSILVSSQRRIVQ
jgi:hypothetical protein